MAAFRKSRSTGLLQLGALALGCVALSRTGTAFVGSNAALTSSRVAVRAAFAAPAPAPSTSTALVKVTEESVAATASLTGGILGFTTGGFWIGAGLFAVGSYLARKDEDASQVVKGISGGILEAINFTADMNEKYEVTDTIGNKVGELVDSAKAGENKEAVSSITNFFDSATDAFKAVDEDIGIKDTVGELLVSASDLASQMVDMAFDLLKEYKITDQIMDQVNKVTERK